MPADRAVLTLECDASLLVAELADLLGSLDAAYEGVFAFEVQLTEVAEYTRRWRRAVPFDLVPGPWGWGGPVPLAPAHVLVAAPDRLLIQGVQLSSPGWVRSLVR